MSTFTGSGAQGSANGTGTAASFNGASGVAINGGGDFFIADRNNNLIRKITSAGVVTTFAGSGAQGLTNGAGTAASFYKPFSTTVDPAGNIFVADQFNSVIREITPTGYVVTLAGTGSIGSTDGIGTSASFDYPAGIVSDGQGHLFVTESLGEKIRKVVTTGYAIDKPLPPGLSFDPATGIISGTPTATSPATNYTVIAYNAAGSSTTVVNIAVISIIAQTITFPPITNKVYGTADFAPGATASSGLPVSYTSSNTAVATITPGGNIHIIGVGTTTITASQAGNASYSAATPVTQSLTVTPAPLTITADNKTKVYGSPNPALSITYSGFVNSETVSILTSPATATTAATTNSPVNTYQITLSGASAANYSITYVVGSLTVTPAPLSVIIDNKTKTAGQPNPALTYTYSGFVNGDGPSSISTSPILQTTATVASPAGTYPITASGAAGSNYTISYVPGTLTVLAAQTISFAPVVKTYGDADFTISASASSGLPVSFSGNNPSVATVSSSGAVHIVSAGTVTITVSQDGNAGFGAATPVSQTLTVNPAPLIINADNKTRPYGTVNPTLTYTYTGFVNGETPAVLTAQPTITTSATISSNVGSYPITTSGASAANYVISNIAGSLTISPVPLTITADDQRRPYAQPNPTLTCTYSGLVNGDTPADMSVQPSLQTTATISSPLGIYPITISGAVNPNYTINYVQGTLSVLLAQTITTFLPPPTKTYGAADFTLSATASSGLPVSFEGSNPAIATVTPTGIVHITGVGTITVTASQNGNSNYAAAPPVTQTFTVMPAPLTVTADNQSKVYNTANPTLTDSYTGFVYGETPSVLTTQPTVTTSATTASDVGTYAITTSGGVAANYILSYVPGILTITPAPRVLTFNDIPTKTYGDADFSLGATITTNETITYTSSNPAVATIINGQVHIVGAGNAIITASVAANPNYVNVSPISKSLLVNKAPQTITFNPIPDQRKGDPDIVLTVSASSGLPVTVTSSDPTKAPITGLTVKLLDIGLITFTATQPGDNNYLPATATQTLVINKALPNLVDIHPIVTPNGDGINDILMIEGIEKYPDNTFSLITRNGVKIYQVSNYNNAGNAFNGYSNITGTLQQQGTYFYSLIFYANGVRQQRVGFIVLKY